MVEAENHPSAVSPDGICSSVDFWLVVLIRKQLKSGCESSVCHRYEVDDDRKKSHSNYLSKENMDINWNGAVEVSMIQTGQASADSTAVRTVV